MRIYSVDDSTTPVEAVPYDRDPVRPEAALESILHANPQLIVDEPLLVVGRQVRLDSGVADLVALDEFANVVVTEVKISRSGAESASEETILSRPQNYASDLSTFDYEALNELYREYCSRLETEEWGVTRSDVPSGTLQSALETTFGRETAAHEFNTEQRLVVVAEEITRRTAANVRYLLEQGLHFQATEVQRFVAPGSSGEQGAILSSSLVVDYDRSRVRLERRGSPTYPELVSAIVEPVFPSFSSVVYAETIAEAFPDGFDTRGAALESRHPDHPDGVMYYVSPEPDRDRVTVGVHNRNELPEVGEKLHENADAFQQAGLTVKDNTRYNLVWKRWPVETAGDVRDLQSEIGEYYERMVLLGHQVLADASPGSESRTATDEI